MLILVRFFKLVAKMYIRFRKKVIDFRLVKCLRWMNTVPQHFHTDFTQ